MAFAISWWFVVCRIAIELRPKREENQGEKTKECKANAVLRYAPATLPWRRTAHSKLAKLKWARRKKHDFAILTGVETKVRTVATSLKMKLTFCRFGETRRRRIARLAVKRMITQWKYILCFWLPDLQLQVPATKHQSVVTCHDCSVHRTLAEKHGQHRRHALHSISQFIFALRVVRSYPMTHNLWFRLSCGSKIHVSHTLRGSKVAFDESTEITYRHANCDTTTKQCLIKANESSPYHQS